MPLAFSPEGVLLFSEARAAHFQVPHHHDTANHSFVLEFHPPTLVRPRASWCAFARGSRTLAWSPRVGLPRRAWPSRERSIHNINVVLERTYGETYTPARYSSGFDAAR